MQDECRDHFYGKAWGKGRRWTYDYPAMARRRKAVYPLR